MGKCALCGTESVTVYEIQDYLGTHDECPDCFLGDEVDEEEDEMMTASVDYFHGRKVVSIEDGSEGTDVPVWTIRLDGDALIHNFDPLYTKPDASLVGMGLQSSTLSATQTTLYFGPDNNPAQVSMSLNPTEYAIADPVYTEGELCYPQRSAPAGITLAAHPDERIAEGPADEDNDGA